MLKNYESNENKISQDFDNLLYGTSTGFLFFLTSTGSFLVISMETLLCWQSFKMKLILSVGLNESLKYTNSLQEFLIDIEGNFLYKF